MGHRVYGNLPPLLEEANHFDDCEKHHRLLLFLEHSIHCLSKEIRPSVSPISEPSPPTRQLDRQPLIMSGVRVPYIHICCFIAKLILLSPTAICRWKGSLFSLKSVSTPIMFLRLLITIRQAPSFAGLSFLKTDDGKDSGCQKRLKEQALRTFSQSLG